MKEILYIDARREGYGIDQIGNTMTVGELIDYLSQFSEDALICLRHDGGYTYGGINQHSFEEGEVYDEDEEESEYEEV